MTDESDFNDGEAKRDFQACCSGLKIPFGVIKILDVFRYTLLLLK